MTKHKSHEASRKTPVNHRLLLVVYALCIMSGITIMLAMPSVSEARSSQQRRIAAIHHVFGASGHDAVRVARCESGLRPWARNGQYLGMFQMGSSERRRFGHGTNAWQQARAAYRYYRLAGWRPWQCKP